MAHGTVEKLFQISLAEVEKCFGIEADLYKTYLEGEVFQNEHLRKIARDRDQDKDWTKRTPLGGPGTALNACVLYALIRHYGIISVIETGVSGGFYSTFILAALRKNDNHGLLTSLEISDNVAEVGKLVPEEYRKVVDGGVDWSLELGRSSLDVFKEWKSKSLIHSAGLYSHDSLHTMSHMLRELAQFKESQSDQFIIFIDDQNSDEFWRKCISMGAFKKPGYDVKYISGNEFKPPYNGHLGGFIRYVKS